jgi:hypothetical protein
MPKKPKDVMLPGVSGVTIDIDDRDNPKVCLVGLLTEEGVAILHAERNRRADDGDGATLFS